MVLSMEVSKGSKRFTEETLRMPWLHMISLRQITRTLECAKLCRNITCLDTLEHIHTLRNIMFLWDSANLFRGNPYLGLGPRSQTCFESCAAWLSGSRSPQLGNGDMTKVRAADVWLLMGCRGPLKWTKSPFAFCSNLFSKIFRSFPRNCQDMGVLPLFFFTHYCCLPALLNCFRSRA